MGKGLGSTGAALSFDRLSVREGFGVPLAQALTLSLSKGEFA